MKVKDLWRGASASMLRSAILTASQCVTYERFRSILGGEDTLQTQVLASGISGLVSTTVTNPVDVIKTRLYSMRIHGEHATLADSALSLAREEGIRGFLKGFWTTFIRLAPQTVLIFVFKDQFLSLWIGWSNQKVS